MTKILMICHGNICRSTMAEFVMKHMTSSSRYDGKFEIASAGTSTEELGSDTHHGTKAKLRSEGIPFTPRKARQVTSADYDYYDYLICMDSRNLRNLKPIIGKDTENKVFLLTDFSGSGRDIADPWYTGNFDDTYNDVTEGCSALLEKLSARE